MRLDETYIIELLNTLEDKDSGNGVWYSDHELIKNGDYPDERSAQYLENQDLSTRTRYHFEKMLDRGLIDENQGRPERVVYSLTDGGHAALAEHRNNVWYKRLARVFGGWLDKAMTSIFLPIIVSVLTVIALKYLGLGAN